MHISRCHSTKVTITEHAKNAPGVGSYVVPAIGVLSHTTSHVEYDMRCRMAYQGVSLSLRVAFQSDLLSMLSGMKKASNRRVQGSSLVLLVVRRNLKSGHTPKNYAAGWYDDPSHEFKYERIIRRGCRSVAQPGR